MSQVPLWIAVLQALLTPAIAVSVAYVAYRQWQTARQKLALDLFDRRFQVYMDFRRIVSELVQLGELSDRGLPNELIARARFLFDEDVLTEIKELHRLVVLHETNDAQASRLIHECFERAHAVFARYMRFVEPA
jgi:hypothetical protein